MLIALSAVGARYLLVGAYALADHGLVRATGHIDLLVEPSPANARKIERAIREFAAVSLEYFGVSVGELSPSRRPFADRRSSWWCRPWRTVPQALLVRMELG